MWANWTRCSGRASAFAPASEQHRRSGAGRDRDGDCRAHHAGETAHVEKPGGEHRAGVPGGDRCVGLVLGDGAHRRDEARVGLRAHGFGRLVRHLDPIRRLHERQAARVQARGPVERHGDPVLGGVERTEDHLVRRPVPAQCVDCDAGHC